MTAQLELVRDVRQDARRRKAYNALTEKVFGFSFEDWYRQGYWTDAHIPYTLFHEGEAVANVSVNRLDVLHPGKITPMLQLGTVMTDPAWRGQGLSRKLMEAVHKDWADRPMFLFANESVLDFYPRFGYQRQRQVQFHAACRGTAGRRQRLDMDAPRDRQLLAAYYQRTNPFSAVQVVNGFGLLMFYCLSFRKDCVYFLPDWDAVVIADREEGVCYDVFGGGGNLLELLSALGKKQIRLAFTPRSLEGVTAAPADDDDDALFVRGGAPLWDSGLFPEISHT